MHESPDQTLVEQLTTELSTKLKILNSILSGQDYMAGQVCVMFSYRILSSLNDHERQPTFHIRLTRWLISSTRRICII